MFTKARNASLDVYVFVAVLLCAETAASHSGRWKLLCCSRRVKKTQLVLAVEPFHRGSGVVILGLGLFHGYFGQGELLLLYSLASCFGGMNKCLGDSCVGPGQKPSPCKGTSSGESVSLSQLVQ